jgi:hypothetical protein
MPFLRCTGKLLADINAEPQAEASPSPLGDWYGHLFSMDRRKCLMFINEPTLFVCPVLDVGKAIYRDIVPLFRTVLAWALRITRFSEDDVAWIVGLHEDMAIGPTVNRSTVASLNNRISNAKTIFHWQGGFDYCYTSSLAVSLNQTPMKPIGYSNGLEEMQALVDRCLNRPARKKISPVPEPEIPCPFCGKPLRSAQAQQCFDCGADWHGKPIAEPAKEQPNRGKEEADS